MGILIPGSIHVGEVRFGIHSLLLSGTSTIIGAQVLMCAFLAKHYCMLHGLLPHDKRMDVLYRWLSLEHVLVLGVILTFCGIGGIAWSGILWSSQHFGALDYEQMMRLIVPSSVAIVIGLQAAFGSFLGSIIGLAVRADN